MKETPCFPGISFLQAVGSKQPAQPGPLGVALFSGFTLKNTV